MEYPALTPGASPQRDNEVCALLAPTISISGLASRVAERVLLARISLFMGMLIRRSAWAGHTLNNGW